MCIAIFSPAGTKFPSIDILHTCWTNNDDGAGFAFPVNNGVKIMKGFMTWHDFEATFQKVTKRYDFDKLPVLMHFRIATHGSRGQDMTHPFPIQYDDGALKKIEYVSDYAVIHNGIVSCVNQYRNSSGLSDTATFCKEYLPLFVNLGKDWLHQKGTMELIHKIIDSKMAIMDKSGFVAMTTGFEEFEGNYFSNSSYKENRYRFNTHVVTTGYGVYSYDDDYDDYCGYSGFNDCGAYDGASYSHYNFTNTTSVGKNTVNTQDNDILDIMCFDSDYTDTDRGLMKMDIGWSIASDGFDITIDSQKDVDTIFIDRKRNVWERCSTLVQDETSGEYVDTTIGFNLIGENGHVFDRNGKEMPWNCDDRVKVEYFIEN